jgi:hypothetical protein
MNNDNDGLLVLFFCSAWAFLPFGQPENSRTLAIIFTGTQLSDGKTLSTFPVSHSLFISGLTVVGF